MGRAKFQEFLPENCHRRYSCVHCRAHLANHDELISKVSSMTGEENGFQLNYVLFSHFKAVKEKLISSTKCKHT